MALDIKQLAKSMYDHRLTNSLESIEETLQSVYDEGKEDGEIMQEARDKAEFLNPQPHYDNSNGSLYKVAKERGWNAYVFDAVKRLDRAEKKGQFKEDLQKTKDVIDIYLREYVPTI